MAEYPKLMLPGLADGDGSLLGSVAHGLTVAALIIGFLYVGSEAFEPLAIAGLLSFILAPLIRKLRKWNLGKVPSVILVVLFAISAIAGLGFVMATQITDLAGELPKHESNLRAKLTTLQGSSLTSSALEKAGQTLKSLQEGIPKPKQEQTAPDFTTKAPNDTREPVLVEVRQPETKRLDSLQELLSPLLSPLATTGLVVLFLVFILMQREDLRDRFLRLAGTTDLQRSTEALDDAAARLSRYFLAQAALNVSFGVVIGLGLWAIGVPNPILWGMLSGIMRFVPYVGAVISAVFPVALAAAVSPGWTMVLETAAFFLVAEVVAGHFIEPMLYGHHTGLSPVAVVVATLFWTLLWGPIGLLLATPLTVCLVVMGRHIAPLEFIDVLLGDQPALQREERFYQRLLARDATEAADTAEVELKTQSLAYYYDDVAMKGLALAYADAARGRVSREKQIEIRATIAELIEDLDDYPDKTPDSDEEPTEKTTGLKSIRSVLPEELSTAWSGEDRVICVAARSGLDEAAALLLTQLLQKHGIAARPEAEGFAISDRQPLGKSFDPMIVCVSYFGASANPAPVRYVIRRLRRILPDAKFVACCWQPSGDKPKGEEWRSAVGADEVVTSLTQAATWCVEEALRHAPSAPVKPDLVSNEIPAVA